jgi:RHS repeat-associated protein
VLERELLHAMDGAQHIAVVETRTRDTTGNDPAPGQLIRYQLSNHLGSATLELDEQAKIISYEEYSPYGSTTYQAVRSQTETSKRIRYAGKERDEESGFYYFEARYYCPWLGRWASCDPSGIADGPNVYVYVSNNPVTRVDTNGRWQTDMHYRAVYMSARFSGATHAQALIAAISSQSLDDKPETSAPDMKIEGIANNPWRIPSMVPSQIQEANNRHALGLTMSESQVVADEGIRRKDILMFGLGLHTVGDFFPHANLSGKWTAGHQVGKNEDGSDTHFFLGDEALHGADKTHKNPTKALYTIQVFMKKWDQFLRHAHKTELTKEQSDLVDKYVRSERDDEKVAAFREAMKGVGVTNKELDDVARFESGAERIKAMQRADALPSGKASIEAATKIWRYQKGNDNFLNTERTPIPSEYPLPPQPSEEWHPLQDFANWLDSGVRSIYGIPY